MPPIFKEKKQQIKYIGFRGKVFYYLHSNEHQSQYSMTVADVVVNHQTLTMQPWSTAKMTAIKSSGHEGARPLEKFEVLQGLVTVTQRVENVCSLIRTILKANIVRHSSTRNVLMHHTWRFHQIWGWQVSGIARDGRSDGRLTKSMTAFCSWHWSIVVICSFAQFYSQMHH